jgi:hypothetical protein
MKIDWQLSQNHFPSVQSVSTFNITNTDKLTNEALNVGTTTIPNEVLWVVTTVIAPGGKLVTICDTHIRIDSTNSKGVARKAAGLKRINGLDLIENRSSIVDTCIVETRRRCQRYWTKVTPSAALRKKPNTLARIFEAADMYD